MYGQIAGAGTAAGVPAALAVTGVTGPGFAVMLGVAAFSIILGITMLRRAHRQS
jgi:hypothetical protein